ncbi:MAG: helix-turn-helix domain-containing protein [Eubacteriaceae bacterium]|jgi:AraC-like DNA-binding protein|nr:helix-turn-helix domain-containing protein [Eubacteriaceae bacterium]
MTLNHRVTPRQPYLPIQMDDYIKKPARCPGISHFYTFHKNPRRPLVSVPDGSVDLLFGLSDNRVEATVSGTVFRAKDWPLGDCDRYFGLRFYPGECILPKALNIKDIIDTDLDIPVSFFGPHLAGDLLAATTLDDQAQAFIRAYTPLVQASETPDTVLVLARYLKQRLSGSGGNLTIRQLSEDSGYSEVYVRRVFERIYGIAPKKFARIVRFQTLLDTLSAGPVPCADTGYYDQAHLIKDFKDFTGLTPSAYRHLTEGTSIKVMAN